MTVSTRRFYSLAAASATALLLWPAADHAIAQSSTPTLQKTFAIGAKRALTKPYSFTGRVFDNANLAFGSGTLLRRHTVLTAAHVLYEPATGFTTSTTFDRALYGNQRLSLSRGLAVSVLSGYQSAAPNGVNPTTESRDLGYVVLVQPSVDEDYAPYARQPQPTYKANNLTDNSGRFVLGYPGVTFNGRTMTYIVPTSPYVEVSSGYYQNFDYIAEQGMSGGPVYAVINGVQTVVGETTDGLTDTTGEFNYSGIRAIDKEVDRFLTAAEYNNGLIAGTTITPVNTTLYPVDPLKNQITVNRGDVVTFNTKVVFSTPNSTGGTASTIRYPELMLTSSLETNTTPGANPTPLVAIKKTANNQFQVTFNPANRTGTTVDLQVQYNKKVNAPSTTPGTGTTGTTSTINAPSTLRVIIR